MTQPLSPVEGVEERSDAPSLRVLSEIGAERRRQIETEGWTLEDDDRHDLGEMADAAACYAAGAGVLGGKQSPLEIWHNGRAHAGDEEWTESREQVTVPAPWPWAGKWWKPKDRRADLVRAGALIVAEIERIDRARASLGNRKDGSSQ